MKKIYFKPPSAPEYFNNNFFRIKSIHNTYYNADKRLRRLGIQINTTDLDKDNRGNLYIYADTPYPWEIKMWWKVIHNIDKNILLGLESPLVNPFNQLAILHIFFKKVFSWDDTIIDNIKFFKFNIQQTNFGINTKKIPFKNKKFMVFINNKKNIPWIFEILSKYKENLYKKRFEVLDFFSKEIPNNFAIFGKGWNEPIPWEVKERLFGVKKYKSYRGEHNENKIKTLSRYKFCLCFENAIAPGYITEKIFDCFKAGCVPIYWGAPNIESFINKECFIDYSFFGRPRDLLKFLEKMDEKTYQNYLKEANKFMKLKTTKKVWFGDQFVRVVSQLTKN